MNLEKLCELEKIFLFFNPLTPAGRLFKETPVFLTEKKEIERRLDAVETAFSFIKTKKIKADKVKYHLKNLPWLDFSRKEHGLPEIFLYKKFLNNYAGLSATLGKKENDFFKTSWESQELLSEISAGSKDDSFYISDAHSPKLGALRKKLAEADSALQAKRKELLSEIKKSSGLDFGELEFLVIKAEKISALNSEKLNVEPRDAFSFVVKPKPDEELFRLNSAREKLVREEKELESEIAAGLSAKILKNEEKIKTYFKTAAEIDFAFAAAEMAIKLGFSRPLLSESGELECSKAFFAPLKIELEKMGLRYTPLSFKFKKRLNVISGSNMGGKTVVIKTLAQLQLLTQLGFFVPAEKFKTRVFDAVFFNGETGEKVAGLSGFGMEINDFINICGHKGSVLVFMDEFGKTTNAREAEALISAIFMDFSQKKETFLFLSTHLSKLKIPETADSLAMKGFNREKFHNLDAEHKGEELGERLKKINRCMDYELIKLKERKAFYDALNIAGILGLPKNILDAALGFMEDTDENGKNETRTLKNQD